MAEANLYGPVQAKLSELLSGVGQTYLLQTGGSKGFTERLKAAIPSGQEIVFKFLNKRPDIIGLVERQSQNHLITVEVKEKTITLDDIYQAKLYKEVFDARYGFLVTAAPIPEEIKRLCRTRVSILHSIDDHTFKFLAIAQFNPVLGFVEWVDENPFEKDYFWK